MIFKSRKFRIFSAGICLYSFMTCNIALAATAGGVDIIAPVAMPAAPSTQSMPSSPSTSSSPSEGNVSNQGIELPGFESTQTPQTQLQLQLQHRIAL